MTRTPKGSCDVKEPAWALGGPDEGAGLGGQVVGCSQQRIFGSMSARDLPALPFH